ncbi:MAG TPA: substrate-binding domain-containing protein [Nitrospiraceae bacterium]|nr:substrate-binding domain-containing protein [Nitrospiraceae bacterium]
MLRTAKGLSQSDLAASAQVTRQAVCAIEANQYLPTTAVALRLAGVLNCRVEDLFRLISTGEMVQGELIAGLGTDSLAHHARVKVAHIGNRLVVRPVADLGEVLNYAIPADGLFSGSVTSSSRADKGARSVRVQLIRDRHLIEQEIAVAGCDPAIFLAGEYLRRHTNTSTVVGWTMGSGAALEALKRGEVHIAGLHIVDSTSGESNLPYVKRHLKGYDVDIVTFARWEEGLIVSAGNPKGIRAITDLARPDVRFINRESGAGARILLDQRLSAAGVPSNRVKGYDRLASSHFHVARLISEGQADVGVGVRFAANYYGLDFVPLQEARYDLVVPKAYLAAHPTLQSFFETIVTHDWTEALTLGDVIAVMENGQVLQVGSPQDVFSRPKNAEVAQIVGVETVVQGHVIEQANGLATVRVNGTTLKGLGSDEIGSPVFVCIRAEDVVLEQAGSGITSARNHLVGKVSEIIPHGVMVQVKIECGFPLVAMVTRGALEDLSLNVGSSVIAAMKAGAVHLVPRA